MRLVWEGLKQAFGARRRWVVDWASNSAEIAPAYAKGESMDSAIIYAVLPSDQTPRARQAARFSFEKSRNLQEKSALRRGKYVWQMGLRESPGALSLTVGACERLAIPYRILPLADAPQWTRVGPSQSA
jgi:hypothetical protein